MHVSFLNDTHLVTKDPLKFNNSINTCLIGLDIILYFSQPLNTCECLGSQIYQ